MALLAGYWAVRVIQQKAGRRMVESQRRISVALSKGAIAQPDDKGKGSDCQQDQVAQSFQAEAFSVRVKNYFSFCGNLSHK